jgi:hypothetical protein
MIHHCERKYFGSLEKEMVCMYDTSKHDLRLMIRKQELQKKRNQALNSRGFQHIMSVYKPKNSPGTL